MPDIDVALTIGSMEIEAQDFEGGLKNVLQDKGINPDKVNVQALDTRTTSTKTQDTSDILADWESRNLLPSVTTGNTTELWLGNQVSDCWEASGSRVSADRSSGRPAKAWINPEVEDSDGSTEVSFTRGIDEDNYGSFSHGDAGFIFGVEDDRNFYAYIMDNHSHYGHVRFDGGGRSLVYIAGTATSFISFNLRF